MLLPAPASCLKPTRGWGKHCPNYISSIKPLLRGDESLPGSLVADMGSGGDHIPRRTRQQLSITTHNSRLITSQSGKSSHVLLVI